MEEEDKCTVQHFSHSPLHGGISLSYLAVIVQANISQSLHKYHSIVRALLRTGGLGK